MTDHGPAEHDVTDVTTRLHAEHRLETGRLQGAVDNLTAIVGWPGFVALASAAIVAWVACNLVSARPVDPAPFVGMQAVLTGAAVLITSLILTTQRREDQLAGHRAQMILELSALNDQKISKIIALIEEGRRDNPQVKDRIDSEAAAMSTPADTRAVLEAIKDVQGERP